jgi:predicted DNA-binding transcriptional regulator AlpA
MTDDRLWTADQVGQRLGFTAKHVRASLRYDPKFPAPFIIGGKLRWRQSEVIAWEETRRESRTDHGLAA